MLVKFVGQSQHNARGLGPRGWMTCVTRVVLDGHWSASVDWLRPGMVRTVPWMGTRRYVCLKASVALSDPDFVNKAAQGLADEINTCIACNQACLDHTFRGLPGAVRVSVPRLRDQYKMSWPHHFLQPYVLFPNVGASYRHTALLCCSVVPGQPAGGV
jgi:hypothetical protein